MYYYIILCSGYRTVSMSLDLATDRQPRASRMSRMFSSLGCASLPHDQQCCLLDSTTILQNPWYDWKGASEASGLDSHWTHACVNCSRVPALIDRARVRVIETPYGGGVRGASSIYLFRHFCQNLRTYLLNL